MIDEADAELKSFRFSYLPYGVPLLPQDPLDKPLTVTDLESVVSATLAHLKGDLVPKLK